MAQRKRDDNKNKICTLQGGGVGRGAERKIVQNAIFHGKRHDNKILKVKILLSRNFVVMAPAPNGQVSRGLISCEQQYMIHVPFLLPVLGRTDSFSHSLLPVFLQESQQNPPKMCAATIPDTSLQIGWDE